MSGQHFGQRQDGAAAVSTIIILLILSLGLLEFLNHRSSDEYDTELDRDLAVEKLYVKNTLKWNLNCLSDEGQACIPGNRLKLFAKNGSELVGLDGKSKIGHWNVKVECETKAPAGYWVSVSRQGPNGEFIDNPLTKKKQGWVELFAMQDYCAEEKLYPPKLVGNVCYGAIQGTEALPPNLDAICNGCIFVNKYCGDTQIPFPTCPVGYVKAFNYVDRYGWGGIDLTKYTLCKKQ